ncbi:MAG: glycosyltransferase, partial [Alphaproteobacteria bacterium]
MFSVVIPTMDEAKTLPRLLAGLQRQIAPSEIILVDGGSRDDTVP